MNKSNSDKTMDRESDQKERISQQRTNEIDYDFVDCTRINYSALYKKNLKSHSLRDDVRNSWEGLRQRMTVQSVDIVRKWWDDLLTSYRAEKKLRMAESRSGNAAPRNRQVFHLYDTMKDMFATSEASRKTTSNYQKNSVKNCEDDVEEQENQQPKQSPADSYKKASGRSGRKNIEILNTARDIKKTILEIQQATEVKKNTAQFDDDQDKLNQDMGELMYFELNRMDRDRAAKKRSELFAIDFSSGE